MNSVDIGNRLKTLRGRKSREEVANALGVSVSAVAMYESGQRVPRDEIKVKYSKLFNRSVQFIFFANK